MEMSGCPNLNLRPPNADAKGGFTWAGWREIEMGSWQRQLPIADDTQ